MSHSENKPRNTQSSTTTVQNLNIQDTEGVTIANSQGVQVQVTDFNALENARDIAESALAGGVDVFNTAADLGIEAIDHSRETFAIGTEAVLTSQAEALDFGRESLDFGRDALDLVGQAGAAVEDTARFSIAESLDFARDVIDFQGASIEGATQSVLNTGLDFFTESLGFAADAGAAALSSADASRDAALDAGRTFFGMAIDAAAGALEAAQSQVADTTAALGAIAKEQSTSEASRLQQVTLYALAAVALVVIFGRSRG